MRGLSFLLLLASLLGPFPAHAAAGSQSPGWSAFRDENGVSWLLSPERERVWSIGINVLNGAGEDEKSRAGRAFHWGRFHTDKSAFVGETAARVRAWGFNTRGGWSDPDPAYGLPHIVETDLGRLSQFHFFEPFDPNMPERVKEVAREVLAPYKNDPHLIGVFTDNETGWWNAPLFRWYLTNEYDSSPTKRVVWGLLYDWYQGDWEKLKQDFAPKHPTDGWESLKSRRADLRIRPGGNGAKFIDWFTWVVARHYYQIMRDAVKEVLPRALVMGDRLPLYYNQAAVQAANGLVDVLSCNVDVDVGDGWTAPYFLEGLTGLSTAPVLVSEFFFAADENRSGNKNSGHLMRVATQAERERGAQRAIRMFASHPGVVGAHWFQYYDEPTGGRGDGEDYNMGLVDIHNKPYEGLVEMFARTNPTLAALHAKSHDGQDNGARPGIVSVIPKASMIRLDNNLLDWDKASTRLLGFQAAAPWKPFADVHLAWSEKGLYLACIGSAYVDLPPLLDYVGEFPAAEAFTLKATSQTPRSVRTTSLHLLPVLSGTFEHRLETKPVMTLARDGRTPEKIALNTGRGGPVRLSDHNRPIPHVTFEMFIPAADLGFPGGLKEGDSLKLNLTLNNYYRAITQSLPFAAESTTPNVAPTREFRLGGVPSGEAS